MSFTKVKNNNLYDPDLVTLAEKGVGTGADQIVQRDGSGDIAGLVKTSDIGVNVQAFDATIVVDADIGTTVQAYDSTIVVDADIGTTVGYLNVPKSGASKTASYTLATTDIGELIEVGSSGSITIPNSTFSTGDVVLIFNNTTGNVTLTCSITTAYIGGTNTDEASITLATRGICNVLFISGTVCVVTGNVT
jgi:hypothetical protein